MADKKKPSLASTQANKLIAGLLERRDNKSTSSISNRHLRISNALITK